MARIEELTHVTFIKQETGEICIRLDDSRLPDDDDTITLPIAMRDPAGGVYFVSDDSQRLADFLTAREPSPAPGVK